MGKSILKRLGALALCAALTGGTALAANTVYRTITVQYSGIKLVVDGVEVTPKDANGTTVEPFIYNGTTYLPVRAVGNAIGKQVTWDGGSQTVYLGEAPGQKNYITTVCPPYESEGYSAPSTMQMGGKLYANGFILSGSKYDDHYALFNLNGQYATLSFDLGHIDGNDMYDGVYNIYLDGQYSQTIELGAEEPVTHFSVPLKHALQLKIVVAHPETSIWSVGYGFANCELS